MTRPWGSRTMLPVSVSGAIPHLKIAVWLSVSPKLHCVVLCFVEMCTKLYNEDEFQPLDPSQEPIFPPELIVSCFAFVVS